MNREPDYYSILGVTRNATDVEIRQAFRALAKKYHPDSQQASGAKSDLDFSRLTEAYDTLKDPERRAAYDEDLSSGRQLTGLGEAGARPNAFFAGVAAGIVIAVAAVGGLLFFGKSSDAPKTQDSLSVAAKTTDRNAAEAETRREKNTEPAEPQTSDQAVSKTSLPTAASAPMQKPPTSADDAAQTPSAPAETGKTQRSASLEKSAGAKNDAPRLAPEPSAKEAAVEPAGEESTLPVAPTADPGWKPASKKGPPSAAGALEVPTGPVSLEVVRHLEPGKGQNESFTDCAHCPEMVIVPAGQGVMGARPESAGYRPEEAPAHRIALKKPLAISKRVITAGNWRACVDAGVCRLTLSSLLAVGPTVPATRLTWFDAKGYVDWLSQSTGRRYRLLSEAEWEYALRATSDRESVERAEQANRAPFDPLAEISGGPFRRMRYEGASVANANTWGLHTGTVFEWVEDCWHANYDRAPGDGAAWLSASGGDCAYRVVRGAMRGDAARFSSRAREFADIGAPMLGFRVAREISSPARTVLGEP